MEADDKAWLNEVLYQFQAQSLSYGTIVNRGTRVVIRLDSPRGPAILKLWNLSDVRSRSRRLLGHTKGAAESSVLQFLAHSSVKVPRFFGHLHVPRQGLKYEEILWMQDLGPVVSLGSRLHSASKTRLEAEVRAINQKIVEITKGLIEAEVFDHDHRIANFVEDVTGRVSRIDFENARIGSSKLFRANREGAMLGALLASYAWLSRYNPEFTREFVKDLYRDIEPSLQTRQIADRKVNSEMERYSQRTGFSLHRGIGL